MQRHQAILKSDMSKRILQLSDDMRKEKNKKVWNRMQEEQAAYKIVLSNMTLYSVVKFSHIKRLPHNESVINA
jgi:hypothetical protein